MPRRSSCHLMAALAFTTTAAAQTSTLGALANSMNRELPHRFGDRTQLVKVTAEGNTLLVYDFAVDRDSPLANGVDVASKTDELCRVEMFRTIMDTLKAQLRYRYVRQDHSPVADFTIDRTICARAAHPDGPG